MLLKCENKGKCGKENVAILDLGTDKVHCSECGVEIKKVTSFSKNALREARQIKKAESTLQAMAVKCNSCNTEATPYVKNGETFCGNCKSSIQVSPHFMQMLKIYQNKG